MLSGIIYTVILFLLFKGELKKTIEILITDDIEPEDDESLMIGLVKTEGGSRILPSSDTVTVVILANDHVAGIVGFHPASRSVIAREGRYRARPSTQSFNIPKPFQLSLSLEMCFKLGELGEFTHSNGRMEQTGPEAVCR